MLVRFAFRFGSACLTGCLLVGLAAAPACKLGDASVYDRGDLGPGSDLNAPYDPFTSGTSTSSSSSSSTGGPPTDDAGLADASDAVAPPACTDFTVGDAAWPWDANINDPYNWHLDAAVGGLGGTLHYRIAPGAPSPQTLAPDAACQHCVSFDTPNEPRRFFFQKSGTSTVTSVSSECFTIQATLTDLVLQEVSYDGNGSPVPLADAACFHATAPVNVSSPGGCQP